MIDIETDVFSLVAGEVRKKFKGCYVTGEYVKTPPSFPAASLIEIDNTAYRTSRDSGSNENHAVLSYEVNVFSNKKSGKKSESKALMNLIDEHMQSIGFTRTFCNPVPNDDATIYRITARYRAVVSKNNEIHNI